MMNDILNFAAIKREAELRKRLDAGETLSPQEEGELGLKSHPGVTGRPRKYDPSSPESSRSYRQAQRRLARRTEQIPADMRCPLCAKLRELTRWVVRSGAKNWPESISQHSAVCVSCYRKTTKKET
jgi:hypothetical protein